ncbi:MAG: energy transducer TonB [Flavobacteriales bacterium]|nr:energy transducer TonB [Flavobacteriales bacterium]MCB0795281.1 energy transducer TonB [Flavobacteriales bacterium]
MENRKNPEADLEKRKSSFLLIGLLCALSMTLVAFEWAKFDRTDSEMGTLDLEFLEEEVIPPSATPPPPPPPPPAPTTVLEIVEDDEEIEEVEIEDTEVDEETIVEVIEAPEENVEEEQIFTIVEEMPQFPGGEQELFKYLGKQMKYPQMAADAGISGVVYVTFVVDKDGKVKDSKVLRGIGGGCDEEALRVVNNMPPWKPGKQRGKAVRVQYNLPIRFTLK